MAIESKRIQVSELDFDQIKTNLKNFLKGQSQFTDYDFEGSSLSILLDVLAYNTHYNALYNNLAVNEMFLDSASKRNSVVSLAKNLGYTPSSATAARAYVDINLTNTGSTPNSVTIPANSPFQTTINGKGYIFYTREEHTIIVSSGQPYVWSNIELIEGTPLTMRYTVSDGQKYIIPNANADLTTLQVIVQESATSDNFTTFTAAPNLVDIDATSRVYFKKEIDNGLFEITFGDGVVSRALENGNVVHLNYFTCNGDAANGARLFTWAGGNLLNGTVSVNTITPAAGGSAPETIDSIKFNAPRVYAAQNRAVTPDDYKALIYAAYPNIQTVNVWGGEDNNPPIYGKTFICARPYNATKLTNQQKSDVLNTLLSSKNVVSITPEMVDPNYLNIALNITVYYNSRETTKTAAQIKTDVINTVFAYDDSDLQRFDSVFRHSKLSRLIDNTDPSIVSNITTVLIRRKTAPRYNVSAEYTINLINPIHSVGVAEGAIYSTGFFVEGSDRIHYLEDDGVGNMVLYYKVASDTTVSDQTTHVVVNPKIGTVDYANGVINLKNLNITAIADIDWEISIKPASYDVVSAWNQIAEIARDHMTVTVIDDATANGDLRAGKNYIFTSSRS